MVNVPLFTPFYGERLELFSGDSARIPKLIEDFLLAAKTSPPSPNLEGGFLAMETEIYDQKDVDDMLNRLFVEQRCVIRLGTPSELLCFRRQVDVFPERAVSMLSREGHFLYWRTACSSSIKFKKWDGRWTCYFKVFVVKKQ